MTGRAKPIVHVLLMAAATFVFVQSQATGTPIQPQVLTSPHPMLFFSLRDVPQLQRKARTTHRAITQRIVEAVKAMKSSPSHFLPPWDHKKFISFWNEEFGNDLCALAMYCVLFPEDKEALNFTLEFMERMAIQPSWEFGAMADEMPISHSLVGMSTAYDFLYPTLTVEQRKRFFERIRKTTRRHFERFKRSTWGSVHLQNHVWNNNVALLIGTLVTMVHDPHPQSNTQQWANFVIQHLNISMNMMKLIVDGSLDEGVSYSTYSTRSITMFVCLLDRHFDIQLYDNYWLKQHFWFLYRTLIGYKENVGIGDASPTWFYGPESMLVFLDRYVLRNGYGNWLAARIRENRLQDPHTILAPTTAQRWSTYFTEFIWYDAELGERNPDPSGEPALTLFSDWGVVTYGGGLPPHNTFFSFKSGYMHGRAVNALVNQRVAFTSNTRDWSSFNPGHEHPDQNSFIFYPRGQPFITEAYYGPKFSFLNNVLMFAPSPKAQCFPPYEGQIGECHKWLNWLSPAAEHNWADIVAAYKERDYAFTSGEAVGWYGEHLALTSVYRSIILLTPDVLLVVDHIQLKPESKLEKVNAFFNMRQGELSLVNNVTAVLKHSNQEFYATWKAASGTSTAKYGGYEYPCEFKTRESQLLNISVQLQKQQPTRVAYVFYHGASPKPSLPQFTQTSGIGFTLEMSISGVDYALSVATHHNNPVDRLNWLGHTGFATVSTSTGDTVKFGHHLIPTRSTSPSSLPLVLVSSMQWSGAELLAQTFQKSFDFAVINLATLQNLFQDSNTNDLQRPAGFFDPCEWSSEALSSLALPEWLHSLSTDSRSTLQRLARAGDSYFASRPDARPVVLIKDYVQLNANLGFLKRLETAKIVYILQRPEAWITHIKKGNYKAALEDIVSAWIKTIQWCPNGAVSKPWIKIDQLISSHAMNSTAIDPLKFLTLLWSAHANSVLHSGLGEEHLLLLWLEDLISEPEKMAERVFQFLGMPFPPASRHSLLQYTRSKVFKLGSGEIFDYQNMNWWEDILGYSDRKVISDIIDSQNMEDVLGYS